MRAAAACIEGMTFESILTRMVFKSPLHLPVLDNQAAVQEAPRGGRARRVVYPPVLNNGAAAQGALAGREELRGLWGPHQ